MELSQHPEYATYLLDQATDRRIHTAMQSWQASGKTILAEKYSLSWTFEQACVFTNELSQLLIEYNRLLWEHFPYCRECGGQCCMRGGSYVGVFDSLALALLGLDFPKLPLRIDARESDCIYRTSQGCAWPTDWRTYKCWLFYCLGPLGSQETLHHQVAAELAEVVDSRLPLVLREYQAMRGKRLADNVEIPLGFAETLGEALDDVFVTPLNQHYQVILKGDKLSYFKNVEAEDNLGVISEVMAFIAKAAEKASGFIMGEQNPDRANTAEQTLEDLELLELIVLGRPENGPKILEEMQARYNLTSKNYLPSGLCDQMKKTILKIWRLYYP